MSILTSPSLAFTSSQPMLVLPPKHLSSPSTPFYPLCLPSTCCHFACGQLKQPLSCSLHSWSAVVLAIYRPPNYRWNYCGTHKSFHRVNLFNALLLLIRNHVGGFVVICVFWPLASSVTSLWTLCMSLSLCSLAFLYILRQPCFSSQLPAAPVSSASSGPAKLPLTPQSLAPVTLPEDQIRTPCYMLQLHCPQF